MENKFKFIDLFCGIGGFHLALSEIGGECVYACDIDEKCREIYRKNFGITPDGDITKVNASDIPDHDVLCAGFPCQAFSIAGKQRGFSDETRGTLFLEICRILKEKQPKYALLENVKNLVKHDGGRTWRIIRSSLMDVGYNVPETPALFSPHYIGVPQQRERVYIMCTRNDIEPVPKFSFDLTDIKQGNIEDILEDEEFTKMRPYMLPDEWVNYLNIWDEFYRNIKADRTPSFTVVSEYMHTKEDNKELWDRYERGEFQRWKEILIEKNYELYMNNREFVDDWRDRAKSNPLFKGAKTRCDWQAGHYDEPSIWEHILKTRQSGLRVKKAINFPTLVVHKELPIIGRRIRYITPRECARLQSFPDWFILDENDDEARKQFGNSVNVDVTRMFAKFLLGDEETRKKYS